MPKSAILRFAPRGKLVGECLPKPCFAACAAYPRPRSCGKKGGHDHAKEIQHTPPQPRCENPAVRRGIRRFHSAACALWYQPVRISPAGDTAHHHTPVIHVSAVNDELLSAVGKLAAEYGRIGGNLNQIARYLNEYGAPYNALSGEIRAAIADLAALKYEVLKKVGDAVGNTQAYQL